MTREKDNFGALKFKIDYEDLPAAERPPLMEKVRKELGRYPKWHKAEKDGTEKDGQPQTAGCDGTFTNNLEEPKIGQMMFCN